MSRARSQYRKQLQKKHRSSFLDLYIDKIYACALQYLQTPLQDFLT